MKENDLIGKEVTGFDCGTTHLSFHYRKTICNVTYDEQVGEKIIVVLFDNADKLAISDNNVQWRFKDKK